ncbi:MAG TPA: ATP synthase F1 subunit gamma [Thermodesulfobacteriota bacterium]|nr:ATP synthase F1 subunit gamma [Thermodesulfobacteriota bacterium]
MASIQILRRRIRSIQGTTKIVRAMEMVATAKMRRTQQRALAGRPYTEKIRQVIADLAVEPLVMGKTLPLLQKREVKKMALVHVGTDRGLCGGLNTNLNRAVADFIAQQKVPVMVTTVGRKARAFARIAKLEVRAEFSGISDRATMQETMAISRVVIDDYSKGEVDLVYLAYPGFVSTMAQKPTIQALLPIEPAKLPPGQVAEYIYEPDPFSVLTELLPRFVEMEIYHAILELIASEQSARMVAMRNAGDNAEDLIKDLKLSLNKVRQEMITKEICDISGGAEALTS